MGSISVSGIASAALILALALSPTSAAAEEGAYRLDVAISGLRSAKGNVLACLSADPKLFPKCEKDPAARKLRIPTGQAATIHFEGLKPGTYALALIHDENANGKIDLAVFIPKEGVGVSRNPTLMGPPSFKSAAFKMGAMDSKIDVKMKYFF